MSTTGLLSRELFGQRGLPGSFYMQGSMGHALAIGPGVALGRPDRTVFVIDGDGAVLMHMGTMSTVGASAPANLVHVTVDNEAYESTGGQPTTSGGTRLDEVARACGYRSVTCCRDRAALESALSAARSRRGPSFVLGQMDLREVLLPPGLQLLSGRATLRQAAAVVRDASHALRSRPQPGAHLVRELIATIANAERVVSQTTSRLGGQRVILDRLVSLSDIDARPIRRGKPQKLTEFGYKVAVADTPEGFVVAQVYRGNPTDDQTLEAAVAAAQAVGMTIRSVAADRGFGDVVGDQALAARGIADKVIPRKGRAHPIERTRNWRRRYRWRAGSEGRISCLKREYGLRRTRLKGRQGAGIWVGFGGPGPQPGPDGGSQLSGRRCSRGQARALILPGRLRTRSRLPRRVFREKVTTGMRGLR